MTISGDHARIDRFAFRDRYVNAHLDRVEARAERLMTLGFHGNPHLDIARRRAPRIDRSNPATAWLIAQLPAMAAWLDLLPTVAALEPLYRPDLEHLPDGTAIDPMSREWFRNLVDARGVRSRAAALTEAILARADDGDRWLSLSSRTARPVLDAAAARAPRGLTLVDPDPDALIRARRIAERRRIAGVRTVRTGILDPAGVEAARRRRVIGGDYGIVEAVGVLQYLPVDDRPGVGARPASGARASAGAVSFLRNAFALVRPGGHLIVANMLDTHPHLAFTLNVLQWPHVRPRSVVDTVDLLVRAGVPSDITVVLPDDGVHALYVARKPGA